LHPFRYQDEHLHDADIKKSVMNALKKRSEERFSVVCRTKNFPAFSRIAAHQTHHRTTFNV
jgi:hypothetical protein